MFGCKASIKLGADEPKPKKEKPADPPPPPPVKEEPKAKPRINLRALKKIGMGPAADVGDKGWTSLEREWARPTAEINGIYGGYMGKGAKTVIHFPSSRDEYGPVEDAFSVVFHAVSGYLTQKRGRPLHH